MNFALGQLARFALRPSLDQIHSTDALENAQLSVDRPIALIAVKGTISFQHNPSPTVRQPARSVGENCPLTGCLSAWKERL